MFAATDSQHTWNVPGTALVEQYSYESILLGIFKSTGTTDKDTMEALDTLGFDDDKAGVYDCYVNHYNDYSWSDIVDMGTAEEDNGVSGSVIQDSLKILGWTKESWDAHSGEGSHHPTPTSDYTAWEELEPEEQQAARELCYLPETWQFMYASDDSGLLDNDLESLWGTVYALQFQEGSAADDGEDGPSPHVNATQVGPVNTNPMMPPPKPINRFYKWNALPPGMLDLVISLGYNETSWSRVYQANVEQIRFDDLTPQDLLAVTSLGFFPRRVYDCWIHHYETYTWEELLIVEEEEATVQSYWEDLGWNQTSWDGLSPPPTSSTTSFDDLSREEQAAVERLCFTKEMWNDGSIDLVEPQAGEPITLAPLIDFSEEVGK